MASRGRALFRVARNSFSASFLPDADKQRHLQAVDDYAARIDAS